MTLSQDATQRDIPTRQSRLGRLMGVQILGVGSYVPDNVIRNEDLAILGYDADWIVQRTGILERRHAPPETATSDMAVEAATLAMRQAKVDPADIDLILLGTFTPDLLLPSAACLVQEKLGLRAPAMDVHAACASFVFAMVTGMQYVATGCSQRVLVIGADCNSRVLNPSDKKTYPLFGDGAGAVVLAPGDESQGLLAFAMGSDGAGADLLHRPMGGTRLPYEPEGAAQGQHFMQMAGQPIFRWAIRMLDETVHQVLETAGKTLADVDLVIFHQANMRIIASAAKSLDLDPAKICNNLDRYGNTSSGSIPLALDEAYQQGRIRPGSLVLFSGFGAGLTWATVLMQW
ncbi:MAG: ketoacyl-ACP synthase III [Pirellulales bacterium]|nr:ketoacyl-ACP synthase III [Pirellulales bacterium]